MAIARIFQNVATLLSMSFEGILVIAINITLLIFYAKDFKIGVIISFLGNALLWALFHYFNGEYGVPMVLTFIFLILMAFSFYAVSKTEATGRGLV